MGKFKTRHVKKIRNVSFGEAIVLGFRNTFVLSGRAQRAEYWWFTLFCLLGDIATVGFDGLVATVFRSEWWGQVSPLGWAFYVITFTPSLTLLGRRLHDVGKSDLWLLAWLAFLTLPSLFALLPISLTIEMFRFLSSIPSPVLTICAFLTVSILIYIFVLTLMDSEKDDNRYGPSVKYIFHEG